MSDLFFIFFLHDKLPLGQGQPIITCMARSNLPGRKMLVLGGSFALALLMLCLNGGSSPGEPTAWQGC